TPFPIVPGVMVPAGIYDHKEAQIVFYTNRSAPLSLSIDSIIGGFFGGERVSLKPTLRYRIGESFSSELSWDYNDISLPVQNGDFRADLGRLRLTYSFTPRIALQTLLQYNQRDELLATNLRFSWVQSANAGFFIVYNEVDDDRFGAPTKPRRELIIKYSRIFDVLR
ncbi:MAG: hypothetical protein H7Y02_08715, partial [Candidatus Obscuribacterales bacterium]|nr:hypothetical protein [Steroidobacteraceae bacterium]